MIKLILIFLLSINDFRVASSDPNGQYIDYHPACAPNSPNLRKLGLDSNPDIICIGKNTEYKDTIFTNGFNWSPPISSNILPHTC